MYKKLLLVLLCLLMGLRIFAQHSLQSIFEDIKTVQDKLPYKPTIVYTYVTWCGGNADDIQKIHTVLKESRGKYNFIVLVDSTQQSKTSSLILDLKPEGYVFLNAYYPTVFFKKKEYRIFAQDFNHKFNMHEVYMGPGSSYIMDCRGRLIKLFNTPDRAEELREYAKCTKRKL